MGAPLCPAESPSTCTTRPREQLRPSRFPTADLLTCRATENRLEVHFAFRVENRAESGAGREVVRQRHGSWTPAPVGLGGACPLPTPALSASTLPPRSPQVMGGCVRDICFMVRSACRIRGSLWRLKPPIARNQLIVGSAK